MSTSGFKKFLIPLVFCFCSIVSFGQTIKYNLPENLKNAVSASDYKFIVDLSVNEVEQRLVVGAVDSAVIFLKEQKGQTINLDDLILKCLTEKDRSKWAVIIQNHMKAVTNAIVDKGKLTLGAFDKIKQFLSIRIYPDAVITQRGGVANLVSRTDLAGTTTLLMLDLPEAFTPVANRDFQQWGKTQEEVFEAALGNVSLQKMKKASKVFNIDGADITFNFIENEDYAASYALDLIKNLPEFVGDLGAVVVMPNKGFVAMCSISKSTPLDFVKFIQQVKQLTDKASAEHPNPVSKEFYWYYHGKFTQIPVNETVNGGISVTAPLELGNLIAESK